MRFGKPAKGFHVLFLFLVAAIVMQAALVAAQGVPPLPPVPTVPPVQQAPAAPPVIEPAVPAVPAAQPKPRLITLDFNNVDLPVLVKFVSEVIGKNFIIDERVRGKVTIFSPAKISVEKVYSVFQSVLELKGLATVSVGEVVQIVPLAEATPERQINVYFLQNANAEEIAKLLTSIATRAATPQAAGKPARSTGDFEGPIQIIPDKTTNALIITSSTRDYEMLKTVIEKLDVKRRQVYVEAVIMEVSQDTIRQIGTDLSAIGAFQTSTDGLTAVGGINQDPVTGFQGIGQITLPQIESLSPVNARVLLTFLQSRSGVNILSTPQILTTDHQKAKIVVGQNVPFVTGTSQTPGGVTQRNITRENVGVTLELTPEILDINKVRMDIRQEISSVTETPQQVLIELGPTINKREASTSVIVDNRQTVVIGGLLRDDISITEKKIPLLGDIPLLGWLFKFRSKQSNKTNLLIFLTPSIVLEAADLEQLRKQKGGEMEQFLSQENVPGGQQREGFLRSINPPPAPQ
jgi:general secretion pathway protein D